MCLKQCTKCKKEDGSNDDYYRRDISEDFEKLFIDNQYVLSVDGDEEELYMGVINPVFCKEITKLLNQKVYLIHDILKYTN